MNNIRIDRRHFMKLSGAFAAALAAQGCTWPSLFSGKPQRRPNIILCMVDDMGKEGVGCYNPSQASPTPTIDRLAREGMKFDHYYVMPQCTPTRAALLTGQYPFRNGWVNHYDVPRWNLKGFNPNTNPCLGTVMKSAGYKTCIAGKWQISDFRREPSTLNDCGFDEYCMWTGAESGNKKSHRRYWDAYIHTKDGSKVYEKQYGPDIFTSFVTDFIGQHKDKPMFIYYPMVLQHNPLEKHPLELSTHAYIDHLVGKIEASVKKAGIAENTILIFFTDNGRVGKGKTIESGVCVPLIVNGPGIVLKGIETDALVDVTDFLPTLAELADADLPQQYTYDGRSFAKLLLGKATDSPREWILSMGGQPCMYPKRGNGPFEGKNKVAYRDRVLRDKSYKVYVNTKGKIEKLIDLKADPLEKRNILSSENPEVKAAIQKFEAAIKQFPEKDNNPRY
ncbi:MAG: sulfatase-like hydrolase/transferase [Planctomycetota bacterium]